MCPRAPAASAVCGTERVRTGCSPSLTEPPEDAPRETLLSARCGGCSSSMQAALYAGSSLCNNLLTYLLRSPGALAEILENFSLS